MKKDTKILNSKKREQLLDAVLNENKADRKWDIKLEQPTGVLGKGIELTNRQLIEIITSYLYGISAEKISEKMSIPYRKVKRVIDVDYKGERAKQRILWAVEFLMKEFEHSPIHRARLNKIKTKCL